ncbi:MAG: hypothetical protein Q4C45_09360 [Oscillospiraceae bacterium]|nr:hypothetical protein [Oscillospiraceae bacterium]
MTREEQRHLRELKRPFEQACRAAGKARGWKAVSGIQYQVRDGILYELFPGLPPVDRGTAVSAWLCCKPLALDEMFWQVFHMAEEAAKKPFSFRVNGAFTAPVLTLERWKTPLPGPEALEETVDAVFDRAETLTGENLFPTAASFRRAVEAETANSRRTLNIILCMLCEGNYAGAAEEISRALARGEDGGFLRLDGGSILEDARDWCAARLGEPV